eukprot:CAMPEP_0175085268 /NCGR_PEP_ID=MMETSP0052_2-20121109/28558_1 /TAXON_ID=51329 ORGANISM="Polytomella parva, Strain SAG 63-3" /NCGR_SAMPLE_ID=MMETSP0052_2 /ASSEMBLY_ACC=CAM_ASM_000194 /LENGTH=36 /DNA_ID= /DNA_START= /DNA_END= /DNA_ORIENTATION=
MPMDERVEEGKADAEESHVSWDKKVEEEEEEEEEEE